MQKTNWGFLVFSFCDCIFNLNRIFCSGNCLSPSLIVKWQKALQMPEVNTMLFLFLPFFFFPAMLHLNWKSGITEVKCSFVTDFDRAKVSQPQTHVNGSLTWLQLECPKPDPFVPSQHPPRAGISPPALLLHEWAFRQIYPQTPSLQRCGRGRRPKRWRDSQEYVTVAQLESPEAGMKLTRKPHFGQNTYKDQAAAYLDLEVQLIFVG